MGETHIFRNDDRRRRIKPDQKFQRCRTQNTAKNDFKALGFPCGGKRSGYFAIDILKPHHNAPHDIAEQRLVDARNRSRFRIGGAKTMFLKLIDHDGGLGPRHFHLIESLNGSQTCSAMSGCRPGPGFRRWTKRVRPRHLG